MSPFADGGGGVTWGDLVRWTPDPLRTAAGETNALARSLAAQAEELRAGTTVVGWVGQTQAAAVARRDRIHGALVEHVADLALCAKALDAAAQDVTGLMTAVHAITKDATTHTLGVDSLGTVSDTATPPSTATTPEAAVAYTRERQAAVDGLATRIAQALRTAAEIDGRLGAALVQASSGSPSHGTARSANDALAAGAGAYHDDVTSAPAGADEATRVAWLATLGQDDVAQVRREHPGWLDPTGLPACTVSSDKWAFDGKVVIASAALGTNGDISLLKSIDKDGNPVWKVRIASGGKAGVSGGLGAKGTMNGDGLGAKLDGGAYLTRETNLVYDFKGNEQAARDYFEHARNSAVPTLVAASAPYAAGAVDRLTSWATGAHTPGEGPSEATYQAGGSADLDGQAAVGLAKIGAKGSAGAVAGVRLAGGTTPWGATETTVYTKVNGKVDGSLAFDPGFATIKGRRTAEGDKMLAVTFKGDQATKAAIEHSYRLGHDASASFGVSHDPYSPKHQTNPPYVDKAKGGANHAIQTVHTYSSELDLTKSAENRKAFEDSVGWMLGSSQAANGSHPPSGPLPFYERLSAAGPEDGAVQTHTSYDLDAQEVSPEAGGSVGVKFSADGKILHETRQINGAWYYDPRTHGWKEWNRCAPAR